MDHLHTINQILETAEEYKIPICMAFIDYEKAFDSIKHTAVFQALENKVSKVDISTFLKMPTTMEQPKLRLTASVRNSR